MEQEHNFGDILRQARESKRLDTKEASVVAKVQSEAIQALEEMDVSALPPRVYTRGFLHKYIEILGIGEEVSADEYLDILFPDTKKFLANPVAEASSRPLSRSRLFTYIGVSLVLASLAFYFSYQFRFLVRLPEIVLEEPAGDMVIAEWTTTPFEVRGRIDPSFRLTLNGRPLYSSEAGEFKQAIYLASGLNTLEFAVTNNLGKTSRVIRHLLVK